MKRALVALFLLIGTMWSATPAMAQHDLYNKYLAPSGTFTANRWSEAANPNYCIESDFPNLLTGTEYTRMRNSTANRVNAWESSTQIDTDWSLLQGECPANISFQDFWNSTDNMVAACQDVFLAYPNAGSRISYENLDWDGTGTAAITMYCDLNSDNFVDFFWIVFDRQTTGYDLHWDVFTNPGSGDYDYSGLLMHEFGHATGFYGHWNNDSTTCISTVGELNTMCSKVVGFHQSGSNPGIWWRTLESHDIAEANQAYP